MTLSLPASGAGQSFLTTVGLTALGFSLFGCVAAAIGLNSGVLKWDPTSEGLLRNALTLVFIPALGEELFFRAPLLRWPSLPLAIFLGIAYVIWHPIAAALWLPAAREPFTAPAFLSITALFAIVATWLVCRSGRLWPAILCHWVMVLSWKQLFGGPIFVGGPA